MVSSCTTAGFERSLAFALAALILLALANAFPFLALKASGLETVMTLPNTAVDLYSEGYTPLAVLVLGVIVAIPALMLGLLVALLVPLIRGRGAPWRTVASQAFGGEGSMGNGGAMRVSPVGAYFAEDLDAVVEHAAASAMVTHAHPDGRAGASTVEDDVEVVADVACALEETHAESRRR